MIDRQKYLERQRRYNVSAKGEARRDRYEQTAKALRRKIEYDRRDGHDTYLQRDRLAERERYEASGSELSFLDWLTVYEPLPRVRAISATGRGVWTKSRSLRCGRTCERPLSQARRSLDRSIERAESFVP
jgi:hypothetical protein